MIDRDADIKRLVTNEAIGAQGARHELGRLCREARDERDEVEAELKRWKGGALAQANEIEQILGKALGYPPLPADWNTTDVCVGDNVPESLAMEAAARIEEAERLRDTVRAFVKVLGDDSRLLDLTQRSMLKRLLTVQAGDAAR